MRPNYLKSITEGQCFARAATQVPSPESDLSDKTDKRADKFSNRDPKVTFYKLFKPMFIIKK